MKQRGRNDRGAVAVVVAVVFMTVVMAAAAAVEIGKTIYVRNNLQNSVDAALIAAAGDAINEADTTTNDQKRQKAIRLVKAYLKANALPPSPSSESGGLVKYNLDDSNDFVVTYVDPDPNNPNTNNEDTLTIALNVRVPMTFFRLFRPEIPLKIEAKAKRPRRPPVEMVIALDTTTSMNDIIQTNPQKTKLDILKIAAKKLVTTVMSWDYARIGLVPFSGYIKLDSETTTYFDKPNQTSRVKWLKFLPRYMGGDTTTRTYCTKSRLDVNCRTIQKWCYNDGVPYDCSYRYCDDACAGRDSSGRDNCVYTCRGEWKTVTSPPSQPWYWSGCMYFRSPPQRYTITNTVNSPYFGIWNFNYCGATPVTDLVDSKATFGARNMKAADWLGAKIDALAANGYGLTYIPAGLIWSWNMLTTETKTVQVTDANGNISSRVVIDDDYPFNSGFSAADAVVRRARKVLVLITDGQNSAFATDNVGVAVPDRTNTQVLGIIQNKAYSPADQARYNTQTETDMTTICGNMKNDTTNPITIYVVALQIDRTSRFFTLLRDNCASGTSADKNKFFFPVDNVADINDAFDKIGASLAINTLLQ